MIISWIVFSFKLLDTASTFFLSFSSSFWFNKTIGTNIATNNAPILIAPKIIVFSSFSTFFQT